MPLLACPAVRSVYPALHCWTSQQWHPNIDTSTVKTIESGKNGMARDNERWLSQLTGNAALQQAALADLREALIRNLRAALSGRANVDDSFLEDSVQDSLLRILDRLHQFEGRSQFLTWATSIAIRIALSELRRQSWRNVSLDEVIGSAEIGPDRAMDNSAGPEIAAERSAIVAKLYQVLQNELTEKQRRALLAELKGVPQDEIASQLGSNRNAVYKLTRPPLPTEVILMSLSQQEVDELLRLIAQTQDVEINCEQCLALVAEFAERDLQGKSIPESLQAIEQHLSICIECREEYEALQRALEKMEH